MEEPGSLQSMGSQRVEHYCVTKHAQPFIFFSVSVKLLLSRHVLSFILFFRFHIIMKAHSEYLSQTNFTKDYTL